MSEQQFNQQGMMEQQQAAKNVQDARQRALDDSAKELQERAEQISRQEADLAERTRRLQGLEFIFDLYLRSTNSDLEQRSQQLSEQEAQIERQQHPVLVSAKKISPLQIIDAQIAQATNTKQIAELVKQRGVLARQIAAETAENRKWIQTKWKIAERYALTPPLIGAGMWMQLHHFTWPGGLMIGGGLFILVPEFVRLYLRQHRPDTTDSDKSASKAEADKVGDKL